MCQTWIFRVPSLHTAGFVFLLALFSYHANGQSPCSVDEQKSPATVTGRFQIGAVTASLTLPRFGRRYNSYPLVLFAEVSGPATGKAWEQLSIRSGSESVPLRNRVTLHVFPRAGERLIFSLDTPDRRSLCSWEPSILFPKKKYPDPDGLGSINTLSFPVAGDPVYLLFRHNFSEGRREFRIGGLPASLLAETPAEVILRDPHPVAGMRMLESEGQAATLRFATVDMQLQPVSANRAVLKLKITGFDLRRPGAVYIWNLDSPTTNVACGHSHSWGDRGSGSFISLLPWIIRDGELTLDCNIQFHQPASPHLKEFLVQLGEDPPAPTLLRVAPRARHLVY